MSLRQSIRAKRSWHSAIWLALLLLAPCANALAQGASQVVINEIDYDQTGTDIAEFIELKNNGSGGVDLGLFSLQLFNGSNNSVYDTIDLPSVTLPAGGYFVICGDSAQVANCDLDVSPNSNLIQNGAPDAVGLFENGALIDAVSYEGSAAAPFVETSGIGVEDDPNVDQAGISRFPDGADSDDNSADFSQRCSTPGSANIAASSNCSAQGGTPQLVVNEIDYDQDGTDNAEFIEIKNIGDGIADLSAFELTLVNGSNGTVYNTIALPSVDLLPGEFFVVCGDAAQVANCDLDVSPDSNLIQNGAPDAVALTSGGSIVDTVSYEGDTAGFTEGNGTGLADDPNVDLAGISRFPDGADSDQNNVDLSQRCITPGFPNTEQASGCSGEAPALVINEIDYDQPSTDTAEFIEIKNTGGSGVDLGGFSLQLVNGANGGAAVYNTINLPSVVLGPGEFFVVCGNPANVPECDLDASPDSNLIQNGSPDAVAIVQGVTVVDTVSYEGSVPGFTEGSGVGLEDNAAAANANRGISRFPDGVDSDVNNVDLSPRCITPGGPNIEASSSCPTPGDPVLVINEVDYDQDGTDETEFIELKNAGAPFADLSRFTVELVNGSNGSVYNSFGLPAQTLAPGDFFVICANAATVSNCDLDVSPDTNLIQNGAPDAIALRRDGALVDSLSYEGDVVGLAEGSGTGLVDDPAFAFAGLSRVPDGFDTDQNNVDFSFVCITPGLGNTIETTGCGPDGPVKEIHEIQGAGASSPFAGQTVITSNNVVTGVANDGFFIQTPDARVDGDPLTSQGLFVFTDSLPTVSVGDLVTVSGQVQEFFDLTELTGSPSVQVVGTAPLPAAAILDQMIPSMDATLPDALERFEGMLVSAEGITVGPTDRFGDAAAVIQGLPRPLREPGIEFPGLPDLPVWDGNPEIFELNPDGAGLPDIDLNALTTFSAAGPLTFSFGDFQIFPTSLTVVPEPSLLKNVRPRAQGEFSIGTLNMFRYFEGTADFAPRTRKFSRFIRVQMDSPDVLAVQEVGTIGALQALANEINMDDASVLYTPFLVEGNDIGGIDVGYLVRDTINVLSVTQIFANEIHTFDGSPLFDRPPLVLEAEFVGGAEPFAFTAIVAHQRSLNDIDDPADGERVRSKRLQQATKLAEEVQDRQTADPGIRLILLGDFNAFQFTDGFVDVMGQITGNLDPLGALLPATDIVDPDLTNHLLSLPEEERFTFLFGGSAQALDHILGSQALTPSVTGIDFTRGNADALNGFVADDSTTLRTSDHDALVLFLRDETQPSASTLCANLGDNQGRFPLDIDSFSFLGEMGEEVSIRLEADPQGQGEGSRATLKLIDRIRRVFLLRLNIGDLPNNISVRLPAEGEYQVFVEEQPRFFPGQHFTGDYCVTLESSGNASQALAPTALVEQR